MFTIHATKKLRDRVKAPLTDPVGAPSTTLGNLEAVLNALGIDPRFVSPRHARRLEGGFRVA